MPEESEKNNNEQDNRRELNIQKRGSRQIENQKKKVVDKAKQELKKKALKAALNKVSIGAAATIIGLIVTWLIMSVQFIFGNMLGAVKEIKLNLWEIIIYFLLSILILGSILLILTLLSVIINAVDIVLDVLIEEIKCWFIIGTC